MKRRSRRRRNFCHVKMLTKAPICVCACAFSCPICTKLIESVPGLFYLEFPFNKKLTVICSFDMSL